MYENSAVQLASMKHMLEAASSGNTTEYDSFIMELNLLTRQSIQGKLKMSKKLARLLAVLANSVASISTTQHKSLCDLILGLHVNQHSEAVQDSFLELIISLCYADTSLIHACVRSLVMNLMPFDVPPQPEFGDKGEWLPPGQMSLTQEKLVLALAKVVAIAPTVTSFLTDVLNTKAPFVLRPPDAHCLFIRGILLIMAYDCFAPIRNKLLEIAIAHMLRVDIMAGSGTDHTTGTFEDERFELENPASNTAPKADAMEERHKESLSIKKQKSLVTMDLLMDMCFQHFAACCNAGQHIELWNAFIQIFDARILNTSGARSTPFLVFYVATQNTSCCLQFVEHMLERLGRPNMPSVLRCSYANYLSSFLARCKVLPIDVIMSTIVSLIEQCEDCARRADHHILQKDSFVFEQELMDDDLATLEHQLFYSLVQGVLYILCYRMKDVLGEIGGQALPMADCLKDLVKRRLGPLLHHKLDPLNSCYAAVAVQFVYQAARLEILECSDLIQWDRIFHTGNKLQAYFPFDPYPLPKSAHYLRVGATYLKWKDRKMEVMMDSLVDRRIGGSCERHLPGAMDISARYCSVNDDSYMEDLSFFSTGQSPMSFA